MQTPAVALPVTVICGFLGAGKTTLLTRLLADPGGERIAVLVNDFGAINIDAELVVEAGADQVALSNGCICCSMRDDLVDALRQIGELDPPPDRLIIEASGISRPLSILEVLEQPEVAERFAINATICLIDADQFPALSYADTELAIDQAVSSDILVLNKCDLASPADIEATTSTMRATLPNIRLLPTVRSDIAREILFGVERRNAPAPAPCRSGPAQAHDGGHHHHDGHAHHAHDADAFHAWNWSTPSALDEAAFRRAMRRLPPGVLRAKGVVKVISAADGAHRAAVFQAVGRRATLELADLPMPDESKIVAIGAAGALDSVELLDLFAGCRVQS